LGRVRAQVPASWDRSDCEKDGMSWIKRAAIIKSVFFMMNK